MGRKEDLARAIGGILIVKACSHDIWLGAICDLNVGRYLTWPSGEGSVVAPRLEKARATYGIIQMRQKVALLDPFLSILLKFRISKKRGNHATTFCALALPHRA